MTDLTAKLRKADKDLRELVPTRNPGLYIKAADKIDRLTSEVERLEKEGDWRAALEDALAEQRK